MGYSREYLARYDGKEMQHVPIYEALYAYRANSSGRAQLAKFVDGSPSPVEVYSIVNSRCDCFGASRGRCKHLDIKDAFEGLRKETRIEGAFYDYDRKIFYVPEDGEGIPLSGVVQL